MQQSEKKSPVNRQHRQTTDGSGMSSSRREMAWPDGRGMWMFCAKLAEGAMMVTLDGMIHAVDKKSF